MKSLMGPPRHLLAYQAPAVRASGATTNHTMALAATSAARGSLRDDRDVLAANPVLKLDGAGTAAPFVGSGASLGVTKLEWEIAV